MAAGDRRSTRYRDDEVDPEEVIEALVGAALDHEHVGELSRDEGPEPVVHVQKLGAHAGGGNQGLGHAEARGHELPQFRQVGAGQVDQSNTRSVPTPSLMPALRSLRRISEREEQAHEEQQGQPHRAEVHVEHEQDAEERQRRGEEQPPAGRGARSVLTQELRVVPAIEGKALHWMRPCSETVPRS